MTTLTAFLDLAVCPVSFDAIVFIAQAEAERRKLGADRLYICAVGEPRRKPQYDEAEADWRLWNIVLPAAKLFGARVMLAADWLQAERIASLKDWKNWPPDWRDQNLRQRWHLVGGLISRHASGEAIPRPRASEHARRKVAERWGHRKFVSMTRRRTYLADRNSLDEEWDRAAAHIAAAGYAVEAISDTSVALAVGRGYSELSLDLRMATYEAAAFNVVANCGPSSLLWLSDRPYAMTDAAAIPEEWESLFVKQGLPRGANWPWALPNQRLLYGRTAAAEIIEAFEAWRSTAA